MEEYEVREIHEKAALGTNIDKLSVFIRSAEFTQVQDKNILKTQLDIMKEYFNILTARIKEF